MTVYTDSTNQVLFEAPKPGNLTANAYDYNFSWRGGGTGLFMDGPTGNVGIGTATPGSYKLNVNGNTNITGTLYVTLGPSVFADIEASNVTANNFTATAVNGTSTLAGGFTVTGNVGIATTTPQALLSVGGTTTGLVAIFGGGSGKIDVGTVDPPYTIGGKRYATYLPAMTGVKEETTGLLNLTRLNLVKSYESYRTYSLDLANAEEGSDLWLFAKTTNLSAEGLDNVTVLLTPNFDGKVWYEKDSKNLKLTIFGSRTSAGSQTSQPLEVSYRLTAPRFDHEGSQFLNVGISTYGNLRPADSASEGFNLDKLLKQ